MSTVLSNELFAQGQVLREPPGRGPGYWVGSPGAFYDETDGGWYLTYRLRRPRGVQPDRGGEVRIARSGQDGIWNDVLAITKDRYDSASIERSCLQRGRDGAWRYFTSYVDPADGRWCTAMLRSPTVEGFDPARRRVIFTGPPLGLEGVKDPWIFEAGGVYHLFLSVATPVAETGVNSHASLDIYNTGECRSATGLALSRDLEHWEWQGVVFAPEGAGWDRYCRRLNSIVPLPTEAGAPARYLGFYDGIAGHHENYEEKCGLAVSTDLQRWRSISPAGPAFTSPHTSRSLRYLDARRAGARWHLFYEFARPDGSHELRLAVCDSAALAPLAD